VLFALSGQLNELGFMGYVGGRLTSLWVASPGPLLTLFCWCFTYYDTICRQPDRADIGSLRRFLGVGVKTGVPAPLMAFALLFASSYFSTIHPQGGSQNVIFVREQLPHSRVNSTDLAC